MKAFAAAARELPELASLLEIRERFGDRAETHVLAVARSGGIEFPIIGIVVGATRADAPTFALVGSVHGLERIGTRVVPAGMHPLAQYLSWDRLLDAALDDLRVVFLPLLNPVGMWLPFLPLTLELGSWLWVKKNPRQLFDVLGGFNPIRPHRLRRTLRRHLPLIEFLLRAVAGGQAWTSFDARERQRLESEAFRRWFD